MSGGVRGRRQKPSPTRSIVIVRTFAYNKDKSVQMENSDSEGGLVDYIMTDEKIKNSSELEFAVFCIENVAAKLGVNAERVYQAFTEQSNILNGYIVPEYEMLHTQSREYIVDDLLDVMKERGVEV